MQHRGVLDRIRLSRVVGPEVDPLRVHAVGPELHAEEAARRGGDHVRVDDAVAEGEAVDLRHPAIERDTALALVAGDGGPALQGPAGRIQRDVDRGEGTLRVQRGGDEDQQQCGESRTGQRRLAGEWSAR